MTINRKRGFACLTPEERGRVASMGGMAAHKSGNAHQFTTEEARAAAHKAHENRRGKLDADILEQAEKIRQTSALLFEPPEETRKTARIFGTMDEDGI